MALGTAIAQGILQGLGTGTQQYFNDQRRERMDARKLARTFDTYKKQADYSAAITAEQTKTKQAHEKETLAEQRAYQKGVITEERKYKTEDLAEQRAYQEKTAETTATRQLKGQKELFKYEAGYKDIQAKSGQISAFEQMAKLSTRDIVYQNAMKASQNFPKADRSQFIRDFMKRNNGVTKAAALEQGGYTLPDYSQYANNPDFADAIPTARIAGMKEAPGMSDVFTYEPPATTEEAEPTDMKQWQVEAQTRKTSYKDTILNTQALGVTDVDPQVLNQLDSQLQFGKQDAVYVDSATGTEVSRPNDYVIRGIQEGRLAVVDGQLTTAVKAQQIQALEQEMQGTPTAPEGGEGVPTEAPQELPMTTAETVRQEKKQQADTKRYRTQAKGIGDKLAKENITGVVEAIDTARADLQGLDDEALAYVYSALNEVQGNPRLAIDAIRKSKDPKAREASMALQSLMGVLNVELKDRSGAAVTEQEAQRFFAELGRASAVGSLGETLKGLDNLTNQKLSKAEGYLQGQEQGTVDEFFATSPKYQKYFEEHETYGTEEGKGRAATRTEIKTVAKELLSRDDISPQEVSAYLEEVYGESAAQYGIELPTM